mgnify:FL=1
MGGGYIQLVAHGAQDVYLTGNPQITFFKVVYRRHTNFAIESIKNIFNGTPSLGSTYTSTISRNGDLIYRMYVQSDITINDSSGNGGWPGESMLKEISLEIGGQVIDKHYSDWLHIWNQLTLTDTQKRLYNKMIGHAACVVDGTKSGYSNTDNSPGGSGTYTVNVPLQFWFCRNAGLALPIIALQYHEVKVKILFADSQANDGNSSVDSIANTDLYVDYIFLDGDERKRFSQTSHEYLIEQLQYTGEKTIAAGDTTSTIKLRYNHPVKELVWVVHQDRTAKNNTADTLRSRQTFGMYTDVSGGSLYAGGASDYDTFIRVGEFLDASGGTIYHGSGPQTADTALRSTCEEITYHPAKWPTEARAPIKEAQVLLNTTPRVALRKGTYFSQTQIFESHSGIPDPGIYVFSFALKPEEHQPSGTCNFSRLDSGQLKFTLKGSGEGLEDVSRTAKIYGVNYNILRIMSGMGGIAFNN